MTSPLQTFARRGTVIVASLATAALALSVSPASAVVPADISGTVTVVTGDIADASLTVTAQQYNVQYDDWYVMDSANVGPDGSYSFPDLSDGTYRLGFSDDTGYYASEFYDGAMTVWTADDVVVADGAPATGKDIQLVVASHIGGEVTAAGSGAGVPDVGVAASVAVEMDGWTTWKYVGEATTDASGNYDLGGLPAATYRLGFFADGYVFEYFGGAADVYEAADVPVGANTTVPGRDVVLDVESFITGQITDKAGPVQGLAVAHSLVTDDGAPYWLSVGFGYTDETGNYTMNQLRGGTYRIEFLGYGDTHVSEFFDNVASVESATDVVVTPGGTVSGMNAELALTPATPPVVVPPVVVPPVVTPPVVTPPLTDVDNTQKPKVQGAKKVGSTLKAKVASWIPAGTKVKYQWLVNGKPIKKATKAKLKVTKKLKGKKVSVQVIATSAGSLPVTVVTKVGKIKG